MADTRSPAFACKASVDLFGLDRVEIIDQLDDIITVGEFDALAAGGQIIFTCQIRSTARVMRSCASRARGSRSELSASLSAAAGSIAATWVRSA